MSIATIQSAVAPFAQSIASTGSRAVSCLTGSLQTAKCSIQHSAIKIARFATYAFHTMGHSLSNAYAFVAAHINKAAHISCSALKTHPCLVVGTIALTAILATVYARSQPTQPEPTFS